MNNPMLRLIVEKRGLIIAIVLALAAAGLAVSWLSQQQQKIEAKWAQRYKELHANTIDAVYAKTDISRGMMISEDMLYTKPITKEGLPQGAAVSIARLVERMALANIKKDQLIFTEMAGWPTDKETTLSMRTPIGKRAITITVDNISSLAGMIKPGDYVDVITLIPLPMQTPEGKPSAQPATVPLFQNVLVLAVGANMATIERAAPSPSRRKAAEETPKDAAPLITLALEPEEISLLAFVQEQGKIRLVLRSPGDAKTELVQPASWETLLKYLFPNVDLTAKPEVKEAPPAVEVIRGFKKEIVPLTQK